MLLYRHKEQNNTHNTHNTTTQTEENKMILSGKDLFNYRVNQIKTVALMVGSVVGMIGFMITIFVMYG